MNTTITLQDKWEKQSGRGYLTGSQVQARLPMLQANRRLISEYEQDLRTVLDNLSTATLQDAIDPARLLSAIRGYGPVKNTAYEKAQPLRQQLLEPISTTISVRQVTV